MKTTRLLALAAVLFSVPMDGAGQQAGEPEGGGIVIDISDPTRSVYKIALPRPRGDAATAATSQAVLQGDFGMTAGFEILDERRYIADLDAEGLGIEPARWSAIGARGVVKAQTTVDGDALVLEMRFYEIGRGSEPTRQHRFLGRKEDLRKFVHRFGNEILEQLTGRTGSFGTRLVFARAMGPGQKEIFAVDSDGFGLERITNDESIAILPAFGPAGSILYTSFKRQKPEIFRTGRREPIFSEAGLNMGVRLSPAGDRLALVLSRDGNPEIYTANLDGREMRRLTDNPGIDVSPAWSPDGSQIAFVSNRGGTPQIYVVDANGGDARRITFAGNYNQTPTWCDLRGGPVILFTGRDAATFDIFSVSPQGGNMARLTQDQGSNMDPACSPDGRLVAFYSSRGGIYTMTPTGYRQTLLVRGHAEAIRWGTEVQ